jgi:L-threonine kinase
MLDATHGHGPWLEPEPAPAGSEAPSVTARCSRTLRRNGGQGRSFASFGEIVQGRRADGEDFLVTIPVDLWSTCRVVCEPVEGPSRVEAPLLKSRRVAERVLELLGLGQGLRLQIELSRDMPVGKGLSSSTADMLAVVRACQELFGVVFSDDCVSRLFAAIEPHDALHYPMSVIYNHRQGRLLEQLGYIPDYRIIAMDAGGEVCTETYNKRLEFSPALISDYQRLYECVVDAFAGRDDAAIARCAVRSTELHVARTGNRFLHRLLVQAGTLDVLGLLTTHSGTCGGLLLPGDAADAELDRVQAQVAHQGAVFRTRTLRVLL